MHPQKLLSRGFVKFGPGWYVKLYKKGDTQHGVAVLMTDHGPTVLQAAESVSAQQPVAIAGVLDELAEVGASLEEDYEETFDIDLEDGDIFDEQMREWDDDDMEDWEALEDEEEEDVSDLLDDPLEYSAGVGAGRGRARRQKRRSRRKARRSKRKTRVQTRRAKSGFRKQVHKAASRLARGKVMKKLRAAKIKILQSPLADAATQMAAKALQAFGVPPQVTKMALNTAREAGIDRGKAGGYAGMIQRATKRGATRGTMAREVLRRQLQAHKEGAKQTFGGGMMDAVRSFGGATKKQQRALKSANRERAVLRAALRS